MSVVTLFLIYLLLCLIYRSRQANQIFVLKALQSIKANKYRKKIDEKIKNHTKRYKWFFFWPIIDLYEWYEDWQANRSQNIKS